MISHSCHPLPPGQRPCPARSVFHRCQATLLGSGLWAVLVLAACSPTVGVANARNAKPWNARLAPLFDDQNDTCLSWVHTQEIWAERERGLHTRRTKQADIIAVGSVRDELETESTVVDRQTTFQFQVTHLLRGTEQDLPDGSRLVQLPLSKDQEERLTKAIRTKRAVLFLRWVKGGNPPFHWHITCASEGVVSRTQALLKARKQAEAPALP